MSPAVLRAGVLAAELAVFLMVTAFTSYFISHASAWQHAPGEAPPARFPVIAFEGDRDRPEPRNYFVVPLGEWQGVSEKRPAATLLLPERGATITMDDGGAASFTVAGEPGSRQAVELTWRTGGGEQKASYIAQAGSIEPRYLRTLGTQTLLMGAAVGFLTGLFTGRALRRRWLAQPGTFAPPTQNN
ncbi:MAG: hypothetical protein ACREVR_15680 [Burkholderiales bacterium]